MTKIEESDNYNQFSLKELDGSEFLLYHPVCRALMGKAKIISRFDDWEIICHNCKRKMHVSEIKFVKIKKKAGKL